MSARRVFTHGKLYCRLFEGCPKELFCTEINILSTNTSFGRLVICDITDGQTEVYIRLVTSPLEPQTPDSRITYRPATDADIRLFLSNWPTAKFDGMFRWIDRIQRRSELSGTERARVLSISEEFKTAPV